MFRTHACVLPLPPVNEVEHFRRVIVYPTTKEPALLIIRHVLFRHGWSREPVFILSFVIDSGSLAIALDIVVRAQLRCFVELVCVRRRG